MYHAYPRRRKSGVILPFLLLLVIGLTAVFASQIWSYFRDSQERKTENKAAVTVNGTVEMKLYGENNWVRAPTGTILREGDSLKTFPGSKLQLSLLNGSFVRLDGDTEIQVQSLRSYDGQDAITVFLQFGDLWLKKTKSEAVKTSFTVVTENFDVRSLSTVFSVSKRSDFNVRVMEGNIEVDAKETVDGKERVFDTLKVGVGQELVVSDAQFQELRGRKNPELVFALSDGFKTSVWYQWNAKQDSSAVSSALTVEEAVSQEKEIPIISAEIVPEKSGESEVMPTPEVTEPNTASRRFKENKVLVRGTTSAKTKKIIVKNFVGGKEDAYTLQRYEPGKTTWSYIAAEELGNLVPGQNRFEIIAVDEKGKSSEPAELILYFEKEKKPADLSAPVVVSYNGQTSGETVEDAVKVEGKIGKGIVKVYVNDFALTRYVPDSGTWVYYAKIEYGNLKEGENEYTIFGMDADGKKTPITKFVIKKLPKPAAAPEAEVPSVN